ncbi:MAG: sugar ABC transporter ATP-binding protein [Chloroflexota bacterium]
MTSADSAAAVPPPAAAGPAISLVGLHKRYGATLAVDGVDLELAAGEIHGLVGVNGAGKSTIIKVLSGAVRPDRGEVRVNGVPIPLGDPAASHHAGIQTVHQEIAHGIVPRHTVAENLALDRLGERDSGVRYRYADTRAEATRIAARLDLASDLDAPIERVGASERQQILIARALARSPRLLILDEPTSALSERETERLFAVVRRLSAEGVAVLYISHRLAEVAGLVHRVSVLRAGRVVRTMEPPFSPAEIGQAMLGHEPAAGVVAPVVLGGVVLSASGIHLRPSARPFDLALRAGEVTGVLGLVGSGKSALLEGLFGARRLALAAAAVDGAPYAPRDPATAVNRGVYLVPEERSVQGVLASWSVASNLALPFLRRIQRLGFLDLGAEKQRGAEAITRLGVVASGPDAPIRTLSGGNQQKVVVGRWLTDGARVLLFDEPFRGIDLGARADITRWIRESAGGHATLVASTDIDELLDVADRILVLVDGSLVEDAPAASRSREAWAALSSGGEPAEVAA